MQSDIVAGKTSKPRGKGRGGIATGGPGVASRAVGTLQSILGHAARLDKLESHPSRGARKLAGKRKQRRLSVTEIKLLGAAMRHAELRQDPPELPQREQFPAGRRLRVDHALRLKTFEPVGEPGKTDFRLSDLTILRRSLRDRGRRFAS